MVSLEQRSTYLQGISENQLLMAFYGLLNKTDQTPRETQDLNETDGIYYAAIKAILHHSAVDFDAPYRLLSKRLPNKNSNAPFIYNDYLIFTIITGVVKFGYDQAWIRQIISIRTKNRISATFESILNVDFYSKAALQEVVCCFLSLVYPDKITKELQNEVYKALIANTVVSGGGNDFLRLCALKTFDEIILSREMIDRKQVDELLGFERLFLKRTDVLSYIFHNIFLALILLLTWWILSKFPDLKSQLSDFGLIVGILGLSFGNLLTGIRKLIKKMIQKSLGYLNAE
jgi:hypothetical protein